MPRVDFDHDVTEDEAIRLVVHHLRLAACYFEVTPDDTEALQKMIVIEEHYHYPAFRAFVDALQKEYSE